MQRPQPRVTPHRHSSRATVKLKRPSLGPWNVLQPWWTGLLFLSGSTCFLVASLCRLSLSISAHRPAFRLLVLTPYLIGSVCYTGGCILPATVELKRWIGSRRQLRRKLSGVSSEAEVVKARQQEAWSRLDLLGSLFAISGGLLINYACSVDLYLGSKAELSFTTDERVLWRITVPTMAGRALFMTAGYVSWAARNRSWSMAAHKGSKHFWWTSVLFFVGTGCFYVGWFFTSSPFSLAPGWVVENWFWVLSGYVAGSSMLFAASYIMLSELSETAAVAAYERLPTQVDRT